MYAYITHLNAKDLICKLNVSKIDSNVKIYKIDFPWFSEYDKKMILAFKLLYKDPESCLQYYNENSESNVKKYVHKDKRPFYHKDPDCERLWSQFYNIKIPEDIKKQGKNAVIKFNKWFKENSNLLEGRVELFLEKLKFDFRRSETSKNFDFKTHDFQCYNNENLEVLDLKIEKHFVSAFIFYRKSIKNQIILDNFGKFSTIHKNMNVLLNNTTQFTNIEIGETLEYFELNFKYPILYLLRDYYRKKYNPLLKFRESVLQQFDCKPCPSCVL